MRSLHRSLLPVLAIAIGVGLAGCKQEGNGTRNIVDVFEINDNEPLLSDVYNFGLNPTDPVDDYIPVDVVDVVLVSRVHDLGLDTVRPGLPFGSVRFNSYDVVFGGDASGGGADLNGDGTVDLPNFTAPMQAYVPVDGFAETSIMLVNGGQKVVAPIACLGPLAGTTTGCSGNTDVEYSTSAMITMRGIEETSGDEVVAVTGVQIQIGQFSDR